MIKPVYTTNPVNIKYLDCIFVLNFEFSNVPAIGLVGWYNKYIVLLLLLLLFIMRMNYEQEYYEYEYEDWGLRTEDWGLRTEDYRL